MTIPTTRQPQTVVLRSVDWRAEIRGELIRLGFDKERADRAALQMLRRILARSQWPESCFRLAERPATAEDRGPRGNLEP